MPRTSDLFQQDFTRLTDGHGNSLKMAKCNYCGKEYATKDGTSNLIRHVRNRHPKEAAAAAQEEGAEQQLLPPCAPSASSSASLDREARLDQDEAMQDSEVTEQTNPPALPSSAPPPCDPSDSSAPMDSEPSLVEEDEATQMMLENQCDPQEVQAAAAAAAEGAAEQQQQLLLQPPCPPSGSSVASVDREARLEQDEVNMGPAVPICGGQEAAATAEEVTEEPHPWALLSQLPSPCDPSGSSASMDSETRNMMFSFGETQVPFFELEPMDYHVSSILTLAPPSAGSLDQNPAFEEASKHLARMLVLRGYDPSILEDDCFKKFVASLNPEFRVPSRIDIEGMCDGAFDEARRDVTTKLHCGACKDRFLLALAVGQAKTLEAGEVTYIACHFIDHEWNLHKLVLDARVLAAHFHALDAPILGVQVRDDAIIDYVISIISKYGIKDRLSSMVAYQRMDDQSHTRLKDYLAVRDLGTDPSITKKSCTSTIYVDNVLHTIARYFLPSDELAKIMHDGICDLSLTRQKRQELLSTLGLDNPWAYGERWYACYCSLTILCHQKTSSIIHSQYGKLLYNVWGAIHGAIQKISDPTSRPTSNLCLQELFNVRKALVVVEIQEDGLCLMTKDQLDAVEKAKRHLDQMIKDLYLIWSIPLAMDPRHKLKSCLSNFSDAFGSDADNYISLIKQKIVELCTGPSSHETLAELHGYLEDPLEEEQTDILIWWKVNQRKYHRLAWVASQALAMPTCSKLSSHQMAHVMSILRGYSKVEFEQKSLFRKERQNFFYEHQLSLMNSSETTIHEDTKEDEEDVIW